MSFIQTEKKKGEGEGKRWEENQGGELGKEGVVVGSEGATVDGAARGGGEEVAGTTGAGVAVAG